MQWCSYFKTHAAGRQNMCLVGFPPGCRSWELSAGENPQENPTGCVCSSPTCRAWKLFLAELVIYIRRSHNSSPLIVAYVYAKPHWWGAWGYISVNYRGFLLILWPVSGGLRVRSLLSGGLCLEFLSAGLSCQRRHAAAARVWLMDRLRPVLCRAKAALIDPTLREIEVRQWIYASLQWNGLLGVAHKGAQR